MLADLRSTRLLSPYTRGRIRRSCRAFRKFVPHGGRLVRIKKYCEKPTRQTFIRSAHPCCRTWEVEVICRFDVGREKVNCPAGAREADLGPPCSGAVGFGRIRSAPTILPGKSCRGGYHPPAQANTAVWAVHSGQPKAAPAVRPCKGFYSPCRVHILPTGRDEP